MRLSAVALAWEGSAAASGAAATAAAITASTSGGLAIEARPTKAPE